MGEPIRSRGGNVGYEQDLDALAQVAPRRAGSEAERRAARDLQQRLEELGRAAEIEPTRIRPGFAVAHLIHAVAGVVGSVVSVYSPPLGLALALAATISAFGDLTGTFFAARALTPIRASQNVFSDEDDGKPGLIVLVAHYDAPLRAMLFGPRLARIWGRALFWSLAVVTVCAAGRLVGLSATWFTLVQFIPTVVLIALSPLFADAAIADTAKGVEDNAAGVALALKLARAYSRRLEHFDVTVLFTGGSATFGLGMRQWLKRHRDDLDPTATAVISLDNLGGPETYYVEKEGAVFTSRMHPTLVEMVREDGAATISREASDAYIARAAGLPALRITSAGTDPDAEVDSDALARAYDMTAALLESIEAEIGPEIS
jgi:Peptidase family M28